MYDLAEWSNQKIYYPYSRPYWLLAAFFFAIIAIFSCCVLIDAYITDIIPGEVAIPLWQLPFFLLGVATLVTFTWFSYYQGRHCRLVISTVNICYVRFGYSICTSWKNIKRVDSHPQTGFGAGFILFEPSIKTNKRFGLLGTLLVPPPPNDTFIPLFVFAKYWSGKDLLEDIKCYAPHLLESFTTTYWK